MLRVEAYLLTDVGRKRPQNEDSVGYFVPDDAQTLAADGQLFVVADGVGGASAGDVASQYAVDKVLHNYFESHEPDLEQRLVAAIRAANADLYDYAVGSGKPRMGTTLVAALIRGSEIHIANVGDSRAYLVRGQSIQQITQDHSLVEQLLREGAITPEEAQDHPRRSLLLRSLGAESKVEVDVFSGQLRSGDTVVLCSDGLTRYVDEYTLYQTVSSLTGEDACRALVRIANEAGGEDNISVIVLHVDPLTPSVFAESTRTGEQPGPPAPLGPGATRPSDALGRSAAASLESLEGKPKTLTALPEPQSMGERVRGLPWRDILYGVGALAAGVAVVLALGFWLPSLGIRIGEPIEPEPELPATTVSATTELVPTETPLPEDLSGIGEATAVPSTITPSPVPTLDPDLTGPVLVFEGEFVYGATPLQSEQALELCEELGSGTCLPEFFEDAEPANSIQMKTYYLDRTEVTNAAYRACVEAGSCTEPEGFEAEGLGIAAYYLDEANRNYPVVGITWSQANTYCRWAGGRLPTEAEWEKAASWVEEAGEKRIWPWGQNWDPLLVNHRNPDQPTVGAEAVGSRPGNVSPYGALDMAGNVAEWVADWYADDYYDSLTSGQANPQGPASPVEARYKVTRGGSWEDNGAFTRTVQRVYALDDHFNRSIGVRCAYDQDPQPGPGPGAGASDAPPLIPGDEPTPSPAP